MREIALFVEDYAHFEVLKALIDRLKNERGVEATRDWRNEKVEPAISPITAPGR